MIVGCTGDLDIPGRDNEVVQPDFSNIDDLEISLFGVYSALKGAYPSSLTWLGDWPSDDLKIVSQNTGQGALVHEWDYIDNDLNVSSVWNIFYRCIRRANFIIENADGFSGNDGVLAMQFKSEALVVRALALLELYKVHGQVYADGSELAVPIVTDPNNILQQVPRANTAELFSFIETDINSVLSAGNLLDGDVNRVSEALAYGILARISMYKRDWSSVVARCNEAISASLVGISAMAEYPSMFGETDADGEAIFKVALDAIDPSIGDGYFFDGIGPLFDASDDLIGLYDVDDVRLTAILADDPAFGSIIGKWYGAPSNRGLHEPFVMRVSELYLLRAEANAEMGNDQLARDDVDALRTNRIPGVGSTTEAGSALMNVIRTERRKEFAYEGMRFFDLKRWGMAVVRTDCTSDECTLDAGNFRFTYPIPRVEIFANDNIVQNPGY